jgi:hypothetical protein
MEIGVLLAQRRVRGLDQQFATGGHRVARVDHEVHDHLLELPRVAPHVARVRWQGQAQRYVLADQPHQHLFDVLDQVVEAQHHGLQYLPATERQELPGERRGSLRGFANLFEILACPTIGGEPFGGEIGIAEDRREDVVEVVGHAARELTDRLHLLCLAQLLFETTALGDLPIVQHQGPHRRIGETVRDRAFPVTPGAVLVVVARLHHDGGPGAVL